MKKSIIWGISLLAVLSVSSSAIDTKVQNILSKIRENQSKIEDMSATVTTKIQSNAKEKKSMEQKGTILIKGENNSRMEMTAPIAQVTITNKDKMAVINPSTGKKIVQDLNKIRKETGKSDIGKNPLDQTKILDYFDLTVEEKGIISKSFVVTGVPKDKNKFMGKIKFYIDAGRYVPTKVEIFNGENKIISSSVLEYKKIKDIWILSKNSSWITIPDGKMDVTMAFDNIKVNEGISDKAFEIK